MARNAWDENLVKQLSEKRGRLRMMSETKLIKGEVETFIIGTKSNTRPALSLIVPTYNESENIFELVNRIEELMSSTNFEIIIVDDNSPDGTSRIVQDLNCIYGNLQLVTRPGKLGLSSAVLHGFERANADVLAVIDADLQHPPEVLLKMYQKLSEGYDLVVASRYVDGGGFRGWKLGRRVISRMATLFAHTLFPNSRRVKDVMSGCFMLKRDVLTDTKLNPIGFKILLEILAKTKINRVAEVPYTFINRRNGKSNLSPIEMSEFIIHVFRILSSSRSEI